MGSNLQVPLLTTTEGNTDHDTLEDASITTSWTEAVLLALLWLPVTIILSSFPMLYVLSLSLPPHENTLGLGKDFLDGIRGMIGVFLYGIKSLALPKLAVCVPCMVYRKGPIPPRVPGLLMMGTMLVVVAFAPFATMLLVNQECLAGWLQLW